QRGLGGISTALLTNRLKSLEEQGMIVRRRAQGQNSYEYHPTQACEALLPVLVSLGEWGICWAKHTLLDDDFDVEFLMFYLERSIEPSAIPGANAVIRFLFTDLEEQREWWLLVKNGSTQLCFKDPGFDIDVYLTGSVRVMTDVWMGDRTYREAIQSGDLDIQGDPALTKNVRAWLKPSVFEGSPREPVTA
ncbi:MAG: winged helix-turn-helix transcriptional regulator, partial [Pseudomonadota bacterium]